MKMPMRFDFKTFAGDLAGLPPAKVKAWIDTGAIDIQRSADGLIVLGPRETTALIVTLRAARAGVRGQALRAIWDEVIRTVQKSEAQKMRCFWVLDMATQWHGGFLTPDERDPIP